MQIHNLRLTPFCEICRWLFTKHYLPPLLSEQHMDAGVHSTTRFSRQLRLLLAAICVVVHVRAFNQQNVTEPFTSQQGGSNSSKMGITLRVEVMLAFPDPETSPEITDGPQCPSSCRTSRHTYQPEG